jgi:hypothetical protein
MTRRSWPHQGRHSQLGQPYADVVNRVEQLRQRGEDKDSVIGRARSIQYRAADPSSEGRPVMEDPTERAGERQLAREPELRYAIDHLPGVGHWFGRGGCLAWLEASRSARQHWP